LRLFTSLGLPISPTHSNPILGCILPVCDRSIHIPVQLFAMANPAWSFILGVILKPFSLCPPYNQVSSCQLGTSPRGLLYRNEVPSVFPDCQVFNATNRHTLFWFVFRRYDVRPDLLNIVVPEVGFEPTRFLCQPLFRHISFLIFPIVWLCRAYCIGRHYPWSFFP